MQTHAEVPDLATVVRQLRARRRRRWRAMQRLAGQASWLSGAGGTSVHEIRAPVTPATRGLCGCPDCSTVPSPAGVDLPLRFPGVRNGATLGRLFQRMRQLGREPHRLGPRGDAWLLQRFAATEASSGLAGPQATQVSPQTVGPNPRLGINKGRYYAQGYGLVGDACDGGAPTACQYGWFDQAACDVAAAGGSVIRQFDNCDLTWRWIFDKGIGPREIPEPAELYRLFTEDAGEVFERFNLMLMACLLHGTRVIPTVFTLGGGSDLNDNKEDEADVDPLLAPGVDYEDIREVSANEGVIIPAELGWGSYYWDPSEIDQPVFDPAIKAFERLCLHILWHDSPIDDPYMLECARRKSLALIAFGTALGEHLALWDTVLAGVGLSITDLVPYVELGNEMAANWLTGNPADGLDRFESSARELGSFMGLLAGPMRQACPKLRFSVPGIAEWGNAEWSTWTRRIDWYRSAITDGLASELASWTLLQQRLAMDTDGLTDLVDAVVWDVENPEQAAWIDTADASGLDLWPPALDKGTVDHRDLLHHANFHWFHYPTNNGLAPSEAGYATSARMLQDIAYFKERLLVNSVGNGTLTLTWAVHPAGFPAEQPAAPDRSDVSWSSFASPMTQAGMVVRLLLTALSQGAEIASWHTHLAGIKGRLGDGWTKYQAMGVRDDLSAGAIEDFRADTDAFRRPSWYAFRRLSALLSGGTTVELIHSSSTHLVVLLLSRSTGFSETAPELTPLVSGTSSKKYKYAYIAWLDQTSSVDEESFFLLDRADPLSTGVLSTAAFARLSLAPAVEHTSTATSTGPCGYAAGEEIEWEWSAGIVPTTFGRSGRPLDAHLADWTTVAEVTPWVGSLKVTVRRATLRSAPVPLCLLTDLDQFATEGWTVPGSEVETIPFDEDDLRPDW